MSVDRKPPVASRLSERLGFWFYLDRAGPAGFGGWVAPRAGLDEPWLDIQFGAHLLRAPLKLDSDTIGGRALYRFDVPLSFPPYAVATFGVSKQTFSMFVVSRYSAAPLAIPAPSHTLRALRPSVPAEGRALVVLAPIDWSFRRQRSQQLTLALSEHYDTTLYLGPASLQLLGDAFDTGEGVSLPLLGAAPDCDFAKRGLTELEAATCAERLSALLGDAAVDIVVQFPSWRALSRLITRARVVYDCIDDHARLPHVTAPLDEDEHALALESKLCLATSAPLQERMAGFGARDVLLAPNATLPPRTDTWPHYRDAAIVYLGAVEPWFDFSLLQAAAEAVPEAEVRVIGALNVALPASLSRRIKFLGEMDHARAMHALRHARVGVIPFQRGALADAVNPVKAYEYLAAGLPVVMTPMGGAELGDARGVSVAETPKAFADGVLQAYSQTSDADRLSFAHWAEGETWDARAAAILARLNA